jgi:hypothetical protein
MFDVCTTGDTAHIDMIFMFLPRDLAVAVIWIISAVKNIDAPMFTRVWQELEYCMDVCRVTRGARIKHL